MKRQLIVASMSSPVPPDYDGVFNPIGKLFIFFHTLKLQWKKHSEDETIRILIRTETETFETRPIVYADQIKIVQGFLMYLCCDAVPSQAPSKTSPLSAF